MARWALATVSSTAMTTEFGTPNRSLSGLSSRRVSARGIDHPPPRTETDLPISDSARVSQD